MATKKAKKAAKKPVKKVAKKPVRKVAKKPVRKVAKKPVRKVAKKPVKKVAAKKPAKKVAAKKPAKKVAAKKPAKKVAKKPARKVAKKPARKVAKKPARKVAKRPVKKVVKKRPPIVIRKPAKVVVKKPAPAPAAPPAPPAPKPPLGAPAGPGVVKRPPPERRVLVLGAGLVSRPLVDYLLRQPGYKVTVATRTVSKAQALVAGRPNGEAVAYDISDAAQLGAMISRHDLTVSLLPYTHHPTVARACIERRKHMVTTSYVGDAMRALDGEAKAAGITILNEMGLDPGIDHMSAMRIIHKVQREGGSIVHFHSYCGGLPAPEANTNPLGYKFSWSPRGVLLAGRNAARYRKDGQLVEIPGPRLFENYWEVKVDDLAFEAYPNRDSLGYLSIYGIESAKTILRGTFRNAGWCRFLKKVADLGLLDETPRTDLGGMNMVQFTRSLVGAAGSADIRLALAQKLDLPPDSEMMLKFEWLGFFSQDPVPTTKGGNIDVLTALMHARMQYAKGERDMIVLRHEFQAEFPGGRREEITSTLLDFGVPGGDSAMARTVSLPAAIAARLVLEGRIERRGVCIPVEPAIFHPVLDELAALGINCVEKTTVR
ncbi:MAG: saccharopine dehydrogenase NADP-binding domain-containing protein [Deltaproteobacteria bacterium]|nr:saccharopine dehydrogenase NADP-binding domain-containing protein [Deltaproteobacteria bacterium]